MVGKAGHTDFEAYDRYFGFSRCVLGDTQHFAVEAAAFHIDLIVKRGRLKSVQTAFCLLQNAEKYSATPSHTQP